MNNHHDVMKNKSWQSRVLSIFFPLTIYSNTFEYRNGAVFDMSNGNKDSLGQDMEPSQSRTFSITMDFPGVPDRVV